MVDFKLLKHLFAQRMERFGEEGKRGDEPSPRPPLKKRLEDHPLEAGTVDMARRIMMEVPDVREELVASIRKKIEDGTFPMDGKTIADRILQETVLNEMS